MEMKYYVEDWEVLRPLKVAIGVLSKTEAVIVELGDGPHRGRGEGIPIFVFDQTSEETIAELEAVHSVITSGNDFQLDELMKPGPARNALDCAMWDLRAKKEGKSIWELTGIPDPGRQVVDQTIGIGTPEEMAANALRNKEYPIIKVKLDNQLVEERMSAIHEAVPECRLVIDVNQGWNLEELKHYAVALQKFGVEMIEQPLPRFQDEELINYESPIILCADETVHTRADLDYVEGRYGMINIKLDKTGGLTEALALAREAEQRGLKIMVGNMGGTSLSMAPAYVIGTFCEYRDLDGPTLYRHDREPAMKYENGYAHSFVPEMWG